MHTNLIREINIINHDYRLDISLEHITEIYGESLLDHLSDMVEDVVANIKFLLFLGFGDDVSDICNRFGIILCEDASSFADRVSALVATIGADYSTKMGKDMSLWEALI